MFVGVRPKNLDPGPINYRGIAVEGATFSGIFKEQIQAVMPPGRNCIRMRCDCRAFPKAQHVHIEGHNKGVPEQQHFAVSGILSPGSPSEKVLKILTVFAHKSSLAAWLFKGAWVM